MSCAASSTPLGCASSGFVADGDRVGRHEKVVRYARPSDVHGDTLNGSAFDRKAADRDGVSVCRLGVFQAEPVGDLDQIRRAMGSRLRLKPAGRLAEISVGAIEDVGREVDELLFVVEDALPAEGGHPANPAHALIDGLPFKGASVGSLSSELAGDLLRRHVSALHAIA